MKSFWRWMTPAVLVLICLRPALAEVSPADARASVRTELAAEYYRRAQYGVAIDEAKKAIEISPTYAPAYGMLALVYMEIRDDVLARTYFNKALSLAPGNPDVLHNHGFFLCQRGEYQAGIDQYLAALRDPLYQTPEKTLIDTGGCAEKMGKIIDAQSYYERALRYQPNNVQAKYLLASVFMKTGRLPEARRYALELVRSPSPQVEALWLALRVEHALGNKEGEQRYAEQLRRVFPDSLETSKLLAGQYD